MGHGSTLTIVRPETPEGFQPRLSRVEDALTVDSPQIVLKLDCGHLKGVPVYGLAEEWLDTFAYCETCAAWLELEDSYPDRPGDGHLCLLDDGVAGSHACSRCGRANTSVLHLKRCPACREKAEVGA